MISEMHQKAEPDQSVSPRITAETIPDQRSKGAEMLECRRIAVSQKPLKQWAQIPDALIREICEFIQGRMGSKSDLLLDLYDTFCEPYWLSKSAMKEFVEKSSIQDSKSKIWQIRGNYKSFLFGNDNGNRKRERSLSFTGSN